MAGIKDVAKHAGVAVGTVSRVINNNSTVNPEIKERVLQAIEELNYVPNEVARSFKLKTTKMVAFLIPSISHPFFAQLGYYIEDELDRRGYKLLLCNSGGKPEKEQYYFDMLAQNKVAGILGITYNEQESKISKEIPFVSIDRRFSEGVTCVTSDNYEGGCIAARELINRGCKKIAFIGGVSTVESEVKKRTTGFEDEAQKNGINPIIFVEKDPISNLHDFVIKFNEKYPDVDGVFAITDYLAATFIQVITKQGKSVPGDVKVIGYDGIQDSDLFHPILATIRQPVQELAIESVDILLKKINSEPILEEVITVPVSFVIGETV